jgi:ubiquinone biosynthesis protein
VAPTLKARHVPRYAELARLLLKHKGAIDVEETDLALLDGETDAGEPTAEDAVRLAESLESLGPTFVKLGQLLSTRSDLLPPVYLEALSRLQDRVQPFPEQEAVVIVEEELGVRLTSAFSEFTSEPVAAASLAQVYRAAMRDGRPVAVKVQRPGVRRQVLEDMEVVMELASFLDEHSGTARRMGFASMADEFRRSLLGELDYRREAENLRLLGEQLRDYERIVIPQPIADFSTDRVLTMSFVAGRNVGSIGPLGRLELDGATLADELFRAYLDQVLVHGFFHADPHPGNVLLTDDGRLALVDLGMVARVAPESRELLLRLLLAASEGNGAQVAESLLALSERLEGFDHEMFSKRVSELVLRAAGSSVADLQAGRLLSELARVSVESGLRPPVELTMLGRALLNLDKVACILDAGFEPAATIRAHAASLMRHRMLEAASPGNLFTAALDAKEFAERLPARLNKVLDSLAEGSFTVNVEGVDESEIMRGVQKLANRFALGVVIAALLLASAVFGTMRGGVRVWGYPLLTVVFLILAVLAALWLLVGVLRSDLPQRPFGPLRRNSRSR